MGDKCTFVTGGTSSEALMKLDSGETWGLASDHTRLTFGDHGCYWWDQLEEQLSRITHSS